MSSGQHAKSGVTRGIRTLINLVIMVVFVLGLSWVLQTFIFQPYEIPSGSMEETIQAGDRVFSEKVSYYFRKPEQGEIVTFADPEVAGRTLIKRVIATEGQVVSLIDGRVIVDGVALDEPYTDGKPSYPLDTAFGVTITYPYTVPPGCVWVMGDNRTNSQDSRHFGAVRLEAVTGRATMIYWPFDDLRFLS